MQGANMKTVAYFFNNKKIAYPSKVCGTQILRPCLAQDLY